MKTIFPVLACALLVLAAAPASAQQSSANAQKSAIRQACRSDFMAHCEGVATGGQAALECLQKNATQLSAPCQEAVASVGGGGAPAGATAGAAAGGTSQPAPQQAPRRSQGASTIRAACAADYHAYCAGVRPGGGRALGCLKEHAASLAPACQSALGALHSAR